ncbi:branched-chain amino acid ABC transporter permease [Oceanibaculum pacificum]|uniref:Branched-chain amino acid ABC transporter permease n=1 Tax=Oceanibaculum pacificum TaxID=580166 RepID=A0A154VS84_9PROT|nr:branched-chain amino acid ABC transporter permease [Oceanibaculum pacificum]KZD04100.1 branched-chain amino acid ABC transporter permease [Oceanibaculum pacificum]
MTGKTLLFAVTGIGLFFALPHMLADFQLFQVCLIAVTALIALGLTVVTGLAGQVSLAQAAFVGIGGYGAAILATRWGVPLWAGIPLSGIVAAMAGFVLGQVTLRVSGHYLALATMAVTAIVQLAFIHMDDITGGAAGMPVPSFEIGGRALTSGGELYYVIVPTTAVLFLIVGNIIRSRFGRAFAATRQSEIAVAAMGVDVLRYKALAFAGSAFLGAVGGGLLAPLASYLDPMQFGIPQSIYYMAIAVVGGLRSPAGAIIGAVVFILIPEFLQAFQSYLGLVFALLLLGFIVLWPNGLSGLIFRRPGARWWGGAAR